MPRFHCPTDLAIGAEIEPQDNPEWSQAKIRQAVPFSALPESLRTKLDEHRTTTNSNFQSNKTLAQ